MPASNQGIIDNINCKLTTGGLTDQQAAQLAGAAQALCCSTTLIVPCCACLPTASSNKGRFVYVQDLSDYRYSNGAIWTNNYCTVQSPNLYTWGGNGFGALGDETTTARSSPGTTAGGGGNWCAVDAGEYLAGIKTDGTLWTWGGNGSGQLGDGTTTNRSSPGTVAGGGTNWCAVSVAIDSSAGIKTDGTLWTWGSNSIGRLGDGTITNRSSPGTVAGGGTNWCAVSKLCRHGAAIKTDGTLWTWGYNGNGQLGDGTTTSRSSPGTTAGGGTNWCAAAVGYKHTAAIKTDGSLWTWGLNTNGQLGDGTTTSRLSPGTTTGGGTDWRVVSTGRNHTTAIKTDGTLWTWGYNFYGQLGDGTVTQRSSPGTVAGGGTNWCTVNTASFHTVAIKTDGTVWTWGLNTGGQLGDGTTTSRRSPGTVLGGGTDWRAISSGTATAALKVPSSGF